MIKIYPAFRDFYGMEESIEHIVSYFRHAAQGLEEKKQILYLLGPVGGGKVRWPKSSKPDREGSVLRHQGFAGARVAAGPVQRG
jgi:predicted Ser/Thr protein kinase